MTGPDVCLCGHPAPCQHTPYEGTQPARRAVTATDHDAIVGLAHAISEAMRAGEARAAGETRRRLHTARMRQLTDHRLKKEAA